MKYRDGLYHKEIRLPKISFRDIEVVLNYSYHAIEAAESDRFGKVELPYSINFNRVELVEVEIHKGRVNKLVVRKHHDSLNDLVLVVLVDTLKVKTVWLNRKNDNHRTLDARKYNK